MATLYSDQIQKVVNAGNSLVSGLTERGAYKRTETFTRNTTNATYGNLANGDTVVLCRLPKGAVVLGGILAQGGLGASVVGSLTVNGQALITASTSLASAAGTAIGATIANGYGYVLPADSDVLLTVSGATPTGGVTISGHVEYVQN